MLLAAIRPDLDVVSFPRSQMPGLILWQCRRNSRGAMLVFLQHVRGFPTNEYDRLYVLKLLKADELSLQVTCTPC